MANNADVSRVLSPDQRALTQVQGLHDKYLSDADVNLIQDLQDWKRRQILDHMTPSGCLTLRPFIFGAGMSNAFFIPAFDFLFRGMVVPVGGFNSSDAAMNLVQLPTPQRGIAGGRTFVVFLEMWYANLLTETGQGYYVSNGSNYFYPNGCVDTPEARILQLPCDTIDPSFGEVTTERIQLQWRLRVQPVSSDYHFNTRRFGLDPDPTTGDSILARGAASAVTALPFSSLIPDTGESTLWRAGGDALGALKTFDGYVYAAPVAVVFQRSLNAFDPETTPFGCARPTGGGSKASGQSGRFDGKFADVIYEGDVIDTRLSVSLTGYDQDVLMAQGQTDLLTGSLRSKIAAGECPQGSVGSVQTYQVGLAPSNVADAWTNIDSLGAFDGFRNGISADERTYTATKSVNPPGTAWKKGDVFSVQVPVGTITSVFVHAFNEAKRPVVLMGTQIKVSGLNTQRVTVELATDITTYAALNPGSRPLRVTVGVTYPAGSGVDLKRVPLKGVVYGRISDPGAGSAGLTLPVFGVSDYESFRTIPAQIAGGKYEIRAYSPKHSSSVFGTRVHLQVANSLAVVDTSANTTTFSVPRTALDGRFSGLYVTRVLDATGADLPVVGRTIVGDTATVAVSGQLDLEAASTLVVLCHSTAQAAVSPAVRGLVAIDEVVLLGSGITSTSPDLVSAVDGRVSAYSVTVSGGTSTITGFVSDCVLRGISGDDIAGSGGFVWVQKGNNTRYVPIACSISISASTFTITVPDANLVNASWFVPVSILPNFGPLVVAVFSSDYVPYQGVGVADREYRVVATQDEALVSTNGTGCAPVPAVDDVFPFDRQLPVVVALPALASWNDSDLKNTPIHSLGLTNHTAKCRDNTEVSIQVPLRVNDFVPPLHGSLRRKIRLSNPAPRGFRTAFPHVGFAINTPAAGGGLGLSYSTEFPLTIYVDNVFGSDNNDGLTIGSALRTVKAALALLPPIICHPVSVLLVANDSKPYNLADLAASDFTLASVEGGIYCMGEIAFNMQGAGKLTVGRAFTGTGTLPVVISGAGFDATKTGNTAPVAFLISNGRVVFDEITFTSFEFATGTAQYGAVRCYNSEVTFKDCLLDKPFVGVTAVQGSSVTWVGGSIDLDSADLGIDVSASTLVIDGPTLVNSSADANTPGVFFVGNMGSNITFTSAHTLAKESGFPTPGSGVKIPTVVRAEMSTSVLVQSGFQTAGYAYIYGNSVVQFQNGMLPPANAQFGYTKVDTTSQAVGLFV